MRLGVRGAPCAGQVRPNGLPCEQLSTLWAPPPLLPGLQPQDIISSRPACAAACLPSQQGDQGLCKPCFLRAHHSTQPVPSFETRSPRRASKKSKGFALVQFSDPQDAVKAHAGGPLCFELVVDAGWGFAGLLSTERACRLVSLGHQLGKPSLKNLACGCAQVRTEAGRVHLSAQPDPHPAGLTFVPCCNTSFLLQSWTAPSSRAASSTSCPASGHLHQPSQQRRARTRMARAARRGPAGAQRCMN